MIEPLLSKAGVPIFLQDYNKKSLPKDSFSKIIKILNILFEEKKTVVLLTGTSSIKKDKFIVLLTTTYLEDNKINSFNFIQTPNPDTYYEDAKVYTILNSCGVSKKSIERLREFFYNKAGKGSIMFIECPSVEMFVALYGEDLYKYIANQLVICDIPEEEMEVILI